MSQSAELWGEDAGAFRPERFEGVRRLRQSQPVGAPGPGGHRFGFIPFGAGQRTCIGQRLAMMEAVQILASVVARYDVALAPENFPQGRPPLPGANDLGGISGIGGDGGGERNVFCQVVEEVGDITLGPKKGLYLSLRRRVRGVQPQPSRL